MYVVRTSLCHWCVRVDLWRHLLRLELRGLLLLSGRLPDAGVLHLHRRCDHLELRRQLLRPALRRKLQHLSDGLRLPSMHALRWRGLHGELRQRTVRSPLRRELQHVPDRLRLHAVHADLQPAGCVHSGVRRPDVQPGLRRELQHLPHGLRMRIL